MFQILNTRGFKYFYILPMLNHIHARKWGITKDVIKHLWLVLIRCHKNKDERKKTEKNNLLFIQSAKVYYEQISLFKSKNVFSKYSI